MHRASQVLPLLTKEAMFFPRYPAEKCSKEIKTFVHWEKKTFDMS